MFCCFFQYLANFKFNVNLTYKEKKKLSIMVTHTPPRRDICGMQCNRTVHKVQCQTAREKYVNLAPRAGHMHAS